MAWRVSMLLLCGGLGACSGSSQSSGGPNYSTTPCFDNCGGDARCQASCQNTGGSHGMPPFGSQRTAFPK